MDFEITKEITGKIALKIEDLQKHYKVGVADGGRCEGGVPRVRGGWAGWAAGVLRVYVDGWSALVGLGRTGRCRVASWV